MNKLLAVVYIVTGLLASAQGSSAAGIDDPVVEAMKEPLGLSDKQVQEWGKINKETRVIMQEYKKALMEANKQSKAKIDALLTPEQKKKYEDYLNPPMPPELVPPEMVPMEAPAEQSAAQ